VTSAFHKDFTQFSIILWEIMLLIEFHEKAGKEGTRHKKYNAYGRNWLAFLLYCLKANKRKSKQLAVVFNNVFREKRILWQITVFLFIIG
jgi:hypothetical protein